MQNMLERIIPGALERPNQVAKLHGQEAFLGAKRREIIASIAAVQIEAATSVADDLATSEEAAERLIAAEHQVKVLEHAVAITRLRRLEAIVKRRRGEAADLRARAAQLRGQAEQIGLKAESILAKLSQLESVPYDLRLLSLMPNSTSFGAPDYRPRSVTLAFEAADCVEQADRLDKSEVETSGSFTGNHEQLRDHGAFRDPDQLAPSAYEIDEWLDKVDGEVEKQYGPRQLKKVYFVAWTNGAIDREAWHVTVKTWDSRALAEPTFRAVA